jgi:hypothetical protein
LTAQTQKRPRYGRFVLAAGLATVALAALGYLPTRRLGGEPAVEAMFAGCAIGWISAVVGAWPLLRDPEATPDARLQGLLLAMALRALTALGLGLVAGLSGLFEIRALLLWIALSYAALLTLEVRFAVKD